MLFLFSPYDVPIILHWLPLIYHINGGFGKCILNMGIIIHKI